MFVDLKKLAALDSNCWVTSLTPWLGFRPSGTWSLSDGLNCLPLPRSVASLKPVCEGCVVSQNQGAGRSPQSGRRPGSGWGVGEI